MNKLTPKQEKFSQTIANDECEFLWEAYAKVYSVSNMSKNTIYQESCRLMASPKISARVAELRKPKTKETELKIADMIAQIRYWVEFDPLVLYDDDGRFKELKSIPKKDRQCLDSIDIQETWRDGAKTGRIVKLKFPEKKGTMDMINKILGAYIKDNLQKGDVVLTDDMREMLKEIK